MQLPIYSYGTRILRTKCKDITAGYPDLSELIEIMWQTLYRADGCGLAAPQVGKPIRLFLVDSKIRYNNLSLPARKRYFDEGDTGIAKTFINAKIISYSDETWVDEEGCLSIPHLSGKVERPWSITIEYLDKKLIKRRKTFSGATARVIQHEYDHTRGVLYLDYLDDFTRRQIEKKLRKIAAGKLHVKYPMIYRKMPVEEKG